MEEDTKRGGTEDEQSQEPATEEDPGRHLAEAEEEIIDLVDVVEEGTGALEEEPVGAEQPSEVPDDEGEFSLEDLDLDAEFGDQEPKLDTVIDPLEAGQGDVSEALNAAEQEVGAMLADEQWTTEDTAAEQAGAEGADVDEETDEALAELFASDEVDVSRMLEEAMEGREEAEEPAGEAPASEEELPEELFADLDMEEEEGAAEGAGQRAFGKDELSEDLFEDLEMEAEGAAEEPAEEVLAAEEELPEELFGDVDMEAEPAAEEAAAGPSEPAREVVVGLTGQPEAGAAQEQMPEGGLTPAAAEELAALVSAEVEAVVTRLVEERLPAIAERIISQEIEKIKATMEQEE
jgi:hypothetical protein